MARASLTQVIEWLSKLMLGTIILDDRQLQTIAPEFQDFEMMF